MQCLTLDVPTAYLLCAGVKDIENRTWKTDKIGEKIYIQTNQGCNYPYFAEDDLPKGSIKRFREWRDENGKEENWMSPYKNIVEKLYNFYKIKKFLEFPETVEHEDWYMKASSIIGWIIIDKITFGGDTENIWSMPGQYHWHIKESGFLEKPITNVKGKLRLWRYEDGRQCIS